MVEEEVLIGEETLSYISNLPIGDFPELLDVDKAGNFEVVDINSLPRGIVTGSNLISFAQDTKPEVRTGVALSMLAAQRVANNDHAILTPDQWIDRHNTVLTNLNWILEESGKIDSKTDNINVALHEAIIPFLTAAFAGAVGAAALIITAIKQLQEMDKSSPWITLFDRESRHFEVTEYQFSVVESSDNVAKLRLASARFDATVGKTQVLFFKVTDQDACFHGVRQTLSTNVSLLTNLNAALEDRLAKFSTGYIRSLPL
jgi:hypothetical protein